MNNLAYTDFLSDKYHDKSDSGFDPIWMPEFLFPFQIALIEWSLKKGKAAIFADCGMGKTPIALVWAQNVVERTNGVVLILTPLAVAAQFIEECEKFGIIATRSDGSDLPNRGIVITNYEKLHLFDKLSRYCQWSQNQNNPISSLDYILCPY